MTRMPRVPLLLPFKYTTPTMVVSSAILSNNVTDREWGKEKPKEGLISFWVIINFIRRLHSADQEQIRKKNDMTILEPFLNSIIRRDVETEIASNQQLALNQRQGQRAGLEKKKIKKAPGTK